MKRSAVCRTIWIVGLVVSVVGLLGCGTKSTKPVETAEVFYLGVWHPSATPALYRIYVWDAASLTLLDSLPVSGTVRDMVVSPDGEALYIYRGPTPWILKLDARTGEELWASEVGARSPVLLLDHSRMLVTGQSVRDMDTGEITRALPDSLTLGYGPEEGTEVAAVVDNEGTVLDSIVTVLDCATGSTRGWFLPRAEGFPLHEVYYARLHPDGRRVLVIGLRFALQDSWFVIGDVETGETLLSHRLVYPFGEVAISPDGSLAAVTDPSWGMIWDSYPTVDLFALDEPRHLARVVSAIAYVTSQARFSSGGEELIVAPGDLAGGPVLKIDITLLTISDTVWIPGCSTVEDRSCPIAGAMALGIRQCPED